MPDYTRLLVEVILLFLSLLFPKTETHSRLVIRNIIFCLSYQVSMIQESTRTQGVRETIPELILTPEPFTDIYDQRG